MRTSSPKKPEPTLPPPAQGSPQRGARRGSRRGEAPLGPGPVRTCVGCRQRRCAASLLRLQIDDAGVLGLAPSPAWPRRSAWVCPERACLQRLEKNPRGLSRALRLSPLPSVEGLRERCGVGLWARSLRALEGCRRSGLVVSGASALAAAAGDVVVVLVAVGARSSLVPAGGGAMVVMDTVGAAALGGLVGRGPRAVIGVRAGHPTIVLQECLQRYCSVR